LVAGADRQRGREVCLPRPGVADEDDRLAVVDPAAFRERGDRGLRDLGVVGEAELLQALDLGDRASMRRRFSRRSARSAISA